MQPKIEWQNDAWVKPSAYAASGKKKVREKENNCLMAKGNNEKNNGKIVG